MLQLTENESHSADLVVSNHVSRMRSILHLKKTLTKCIMKLCYPTTYYPYYKESFLSLEYLKEIVMIVVDDLFAIGEMFRE